MTQHNLTPVVVNELHHGYAPTVEIASGIAVPALDAVERIDRITDAMEQESHWEIKTAEAHGSTSILAVHDGDLVDFLASAWDRPGLRPADGSHYIVGDTFLHERLRAGMGPQPNGNTPNIGAYCFDTIASIGPETYSSALGAVDAALTAADLSLAGEPCAVALCRPPGHHVTRDLFGGGCFLNNAAITAQALRDSGRDTVAIVDIDFHHGNGTQSLFYGRADVFFGSLHGNPEEHYPYYTGWPEEHGAGAGQGTTRNILLPPGCDGDTYRARLADLLEQVAGFAPQSLIVSLGVDTAINDPAGDARLTAADFHRVGKDLGDLGLPSVLLLEGGYELDTLGENFTSCVNGFLDAQHSTCKPIGHPK
jgi:acetoin utilization deacetylase AcuC-like enzyme